MTIEFINQTIKKDIKKYTLGQAIRVVSYYLHELYPKEDSETLYKRIDFQSNASLAFQKTEIHDVEFISYNKQTRVNMTLNFMSLIGVSSPLPAHYNERVLDSKNQDKGLYDFINLFNKNIQKFIYPIWQKQRYHIQYQDDLKDNFSKYMLSILGLNANIGANDNKMNLNKLLPYIGILSMKQKSASTLATIMKFYIDFDDIEIDQCIIMDSKIPSWQYGQLGDENSTLGQDLLIGKFVKNRTSKFRIILKNATSADMIRYSILGNKMDILKDLISFVVNEPLEYDVCLDIKIDKKDDYILKEKNPRYLGINTWIGNHVRDEQLLIAQKV